MTDPMKEFVELAGASEGVPVAKVKSLSAVVGTLMWLAYLPADEQQQFWLDLHRALDEVHATTPQEFGTHLHFGEAAAKAAGPVLHEWKAAAQAHADGLPEILATVGQGDFVEVEAPQAPYEPKYVKDSIISVKAFARDAWGNRFRILDIVRGYYRLKPLSGDSFSFDVVLWKCQDADVDKHVTVEWIDDNPKYGVIEQGSRRPRLVTTGELKDLGVASDESP